MALRFYMVPISNYVVTSPYSIKHGFRLGDLIIFRSILNTFESSVIFEAPGVVEKIGSDPKLNLCEQLKLVKYR
jgi:hypothetical protein